MADNDAPTNSYEIKSNDVFQPTEDNNEPACDEIGSHKTVVSNFTEPIRFFLYIDLKLSIVRRMVKDEKNSGTKEHIKQKSVKSFPQIFKVIQAANRTESKNI